jgi:hypothetical protein
MMFLVTAFNLAQKCFYLSSKDSGVLKEKSSKTHPSQPAQSAREFLENHYSRAFRFAGRSMKARKRNANRSANSSYAFGLPFAFFTAWKWKATVQQLLHFMTAIYLSALASHQHN